METIIEFIVENWGALFFIIGIAILAVMSTIIAKSSTKSKTVSISLVIIQALFAWYLTAELDDDIKYYKAQNERLQKRVVVELKKLGATSAQIDKVTKDINTKADSININIDRSFKELTSRLDDLGDKLNKVYNMSEDHEWGEVLEALIANVEARSQIHREIINLYSNYKVAEDSEIQAKLIDLIIWTNVYRYNNNNGMVEGIITTEIENTRRLIHRKVSKRKERNSSLQYLDELSTVLI
ncbi:MAG: hypothetical protein R8G66_09825 [Cytophagales bacterium]|nr:hypothetical protein [Cytophagales bacterium]